jgi:hypothetical protein
VPLSRSRASQSISDVSLTLLDQVEEFLVFYNKGRRKKFKGTGTGGPKKAPRSEAWHQAHRTLTGVEGFADAARI